VSELKECAKYYYDNGTWYGQILKTATSQCTLTDDEGRSIQVVNVVYISAENKPIGLAWYVSQASAEATTMLNITKTTDGQPNFPGVCSGLKWWAWLLIALAIVLVVIAIGVCVHKRRHHHDETVHLVSDHHNNRPIYN